MKTRTLQVCQMVHSGEALVCGSHLPGCHHPICPHQLLHGHLHGSRGEQKTFFKYSWRFLLWNHILVFYSFLRWYLVPVLTKTGTMIFELLSIETLRSTESQCGWSGASLARSLVLSTNGSYNKVCHLPVLSASPVQPLLCLQQLHRDLWPPLPLGQQLHR